MTHEVLELLLHRDAVMTEDALRRSYAEDPDLMTLLNAERYSLFAGGKRIRPTLVLEFCRLFDGEDEAAMPFACAVEMIHTYSLIHDDLPCMDDDDLRRGKPSNHKVFGDAMAVLAGDALLTGAFEIAASNTAAGAEISAMAVAYLAGNVGRYGMVGGQVMDLEGEEKELTLDQLLKLHSLKTGALITASCVLGALAAGVSFADERMRDVITYSENIGLAFQIVDDILDRTGDADTMGKLVGRDEKHKKNTFLRFFSVEEAGFYAERLTQEAVRALRRHRGSDALCTLAEWLVKRKA
ncbi:MAG: polyprenyl synthetase family protein [Clostridia bacterium]|nr:polyprenyl synthetase family protein [Clostridia bacterium]MBQ2249960.1 polyprenyl synthetase family protein [Clostridia bacterium]MBQ5612180.1 polyprenyl synthetase family protein [Clostridia bacterium]MBQ5661550.1 polyprenyl synthetase family protein [Clostridia bacterium]MBQ5772381.1 polyprenyl synthetase family protein [Clostridia bacterium]